MSGITSQGYRRIYKPGHPLSRADGWLLEHRLVAWEHFGPFDLTLHVHHVNGDRLDNRVENLELVSHAEHKAHHRRYDRREIVRLYQEGMTTRAVSAELGVNSGHVSRVLAAEGVQPRR